MTPEIDVAAYLSQVVDSLTENTNLWYGCVLPPDDNVPELAAFVLLSGGEEPLAFADNQGTGSENKATVQVFVRGEKYKYPAAMALAREIYSALKYASISGYVECAPQQSAPIFLGLDKDGRPAISINYRLIYDED